jgi:hypothetical protein
MFAVGVWACGDTGTSDGRSGDGGSGGTPPPPANIDQACRAWCANEPEGLSCHQGPAGSVQGCYEDCLRDYQNEAERQCGEEWIAIKDCQLDLDCEDLFGDCDSVEDAHDECFQRAANRDYCEANCPEFDLGQCEQDTTECSEFALANSYCASNCPTQGREQCIEEYSSTGTCDRVEVSCGELCGWPDECFAQLGAPLEGADCVQTCEAQAELVGIACISAISSTIECLGTCDVESLTVEQQLACADEAEAISAACE